MKVYVPSATNLSRAMTRVEDALTRYYPWRRDVSLTRLRSAADVVIVHVVGYPDTVEYAQKCWDAGQQVVFIQYCLRTTQQAKCEGWRELWERALLTWSYYDLRALANEEGTDTGRCRFYHSPLGADPDVFFPAVATAKRWAILTSGYVADTECAHEAAEAARMVGRATYHLGPNLNLGQNVTHEMGRTDRQLAEAYRACSYVAGLRRIEGFELPAAEGALCGTRPVLFDKPHYKNFHAGWGRFIPEGSFNEVRDSLAALFNNEEPMTHAEVHAARYMFDWKRIAEGFWANLR